jgi:hypothetical protein
MRVWLRCDYTYQIEGKGARVRSIKKETVNQEQDQYAVLSGFLSWCTVMRQVVGLDVEGVETCSPAFVRACLLRDRAEYVATW